MHAGQEQLQPALARDRVDPADDCTLDRSSCSPRWRATESIPRMISEKNSP